MVAPDAVAAPDMVPWIDGPGRAPAEGKEAVIAAVEADGLAVDNFASCARTKADTRSFSPGDKLRLWS
jgi:hypothetical protein